MSKQQVRNLSQQELRWLLEGVSIQQPKAITKCGEYFGERFYEYIKILETQLAESNKQIEALTEQVRQLTKALYSSKSEKSKYQVPEGQGSLFDDDPSFSESEQTEEKSTETISYTVNRKKTNKKRNDSFEEHIEIEEFHYHPNDSSCDCCHEPTVEFGSVLVREEAKFTPATLKRGQYFEHVYECRSCKSDSLKKSQIKRGQAPKGAIQRSIAGPTVLAKLIYDKFAQILKRSDGSPAQSNAYNWVARSVQVKAQ